MAGSSKVQHSIGNDSPVYKYKGGVETLYLEASDKATDDMIAQQLSMGEYIARVEAPKKHIKIRNNHVSKSQTVHLSEHQKRKKVLKEREQGFDLRYEKPKQFAEALERSGA